MSIIAEVIDHYGEYTATLEREYIRSLQRIPEPEPPKPPRDPYQHIGSEVADVLAVFMRKFPQAWSIEHLCDLHPQYERAQIMSGLERLLYRKYVDRIGSKAGYMRPQRYRWVTA